MVYQKVRGKFKKRKLDAIKKNTLSFHKSTKESALGGVGKVAKQRMPFGPANYSRGAGGGRPVNQQNQPTQMSDLAFVKTMEQRLKDIQKENLGALRSVEKDLGRDIKELSRDTVKLNTFRDTSKETLADLNKRVKDSQKELEQNLSLVSAFSFTPEQTALTEIISDREVPLKERKQAMKQLGKMVNKDFEAIRKGGLYDTTPAGGSLHNISDPKTPKQKLEEVDPEELPDADPPKPVFGVEEAEKKEQDTQAEAQANRDAEATDADMSEPTPREKAEGVFQVDGEVARAAEAEKEPEEDTDIEFEDAPAIVGSKPPVETFNEKPGEFVPQPTTNQPSVTIKQDPDLGEEAKEEDEAMPAQSAPITREPREDESEQPTKKQAIDPNIKEEVQQPQKPGIRISKKDHPYTEQQASQILKGESGVDVAFDDI